MSKLNWFLQNKPLLKYLSRVWVLVELVTITMNQDEVNLL